VALSSKYRRPFSLKLILALWKASFLPKGISDPHPSTQEPYCNHTRNKTIPDSLFASHHSRQEVNILTSEVSIPAETAGEGNGQQDANLEVK
jgi:hypothetical protein